MKLRSVEEIKMDYLLKRDINSLKYPKINSKNIFLESLGSYKESLIKDASGGFDILFQFSKDFLNSQLNANLFVNNSPTNITFNYDESLLTGYVKEQINKIVKKINLTEAQKNNGILIWPFKPFSFNIIASNPILELSPDPDKEIIVTWDLIVELNLVKGSDEKKNLFYEPIFLAKGKIETYPYIKINKPSLAPNQVEAKLIFLTSYHNIIDSDQILKELIKGFVPSSDLISAVNSIFKNIGFSISPLITPHLALAGSMYPGDKLDGITNFDAQYTITPDGNSFALSIGINTNLGKVGSKAQIKSILPEKANFGYLISENIAISVIKHHWKDKVANNGFFNEVPVPIQDPDDENKIVYGKAIVKWIWKKLLDVSISPKREKPTGAIRIKFTGDLKILSMWDHENHIVSSEKQPDLFKIVTNEYTADLYLFDFEQSLEDSNQEKYGIAKIALDLLKTIYRPTIYDLTLKNVSGRVYNTSKLIFVCGDLSAGGV